MLAIVVGEQAGLIEHGVVRHSQSARVAGASAQLFGLSTGAGCLQLPFLPVSIQLPPVKKIGLVGVKGRLVQLHSMLS